MRRFNLNPNVSLDQFLVYLCAGFFLYFMFSVLCWRCIDDGGGDTTGIQKTMTFRLKLMLFCWASCAAVYGWRCW